MPETVYILLGSNVGDRERMLAAARDRLEGLEGLEVIDASAIYVSDAQEMEGENPSFLNQVVKADYRYTPHQLLHALEAVELHMGRTDKGGNRPRTIDLDVLLFGRQIVKSETLSIPHAELLRRPFAMVPLLELDPDLCHPASNRPIADFLDEKGRQSVILYKEHVSGNL